MNLQTLFCWIISIFSIYPLIGQSFTPCQFRDITTQTRVQLPTCNGSDGEIFLLNTEGGKFPYRYRSGDSSNQTGVFTNLVLGVYEFIVEDADGCQKPHTVRLLYEEIEQIVKPNNTFTPNGDGINDLWFIRGIESFDGATVRVFNRWGQQIYVNSDYLNEFGWNGLQGTSRVPAGTYYYVISLFNNCIEEAIKGTVTIIR